MASRTALVPHPEELEYALSILTNVLDTLGIDYGFIGGAAVATAAGEYGLPQRVTEDIDLIIQPTNGITATTVSEQLCKDPRFSQWIRAGELYGTPRPQVIVMRGNREILVDIEIFDHAAWPNRRDYYDLARSLNSRIEMTVHGRSARFLNANWLLRQKISSYPRRGNPAKRQGDMEDIGTLCEILNGTGQTLEITLSEEVTALKTVYKAADGETRRKLQRAVNCPQAFSSTSSSGTTSASTSASAASTSG